MNLSNFLADYLYELSLAILSGITLLIIKKGQYIKRMCRKTWAYITNKQFLLDVQITAVYKNKPQEKFDWGKIRSLLSKVEGVDLQSLYVSPEYFSYWNEESACFVQVFLNDEEELSGISVEDLSFLGSLVVETRRPLLFGYRNTKFLDVFIEQGFILIDKLSKYFKQEEPDEKWINISFKGKSKNSTAKNRRNAIKEAKKIVIET